MRPQAIRQRLRSTSKKRDADLAMLARATGRKPISEWDLEELARGKPRRADGTWPGRAGRWITPAVQEEVKRRFRTKAFQELSVHVVPAIKLLAEMLVSEEKDQEGRPIVSAKERIEIAKFIVEHVIGKPDAKLELAGPPRYKEMLANALVLDDGTPAYGSGVIEGEVVEDDDEVPDV